MTSLLTGLALCCLLARARGLRRFSYPFSLSPFLRHLSLSLSPRQLSFTTAAHGCGGASVRARMHGATTTPMHFRTHTRPRSRALSTDCDHCRSSTIPRLVPLALPPSTARSRSLPPLLALTRARAFPDTQLSISR